MYIVTHPGKAHRDEFMACCLLLASDFDIDKIVRREPTGDELNDPNVLVVDVGQCRDITLRNLDHHQLPADGDPICSITLVLELLGIDLSVARKALRWLEFAEWLDDRGPVQTAKHFIIPQDSLVCTVSPVETAMLRYFERCYSVQRAGGMHNDLFRMMEEIGDQYLSYAKEFAERYEWLMKECPVEQIAVGSDASYVDLRGIAPWCDPVMAVEAFIKDSGLDIPISVSLADSDRNPGCFVIYRRNDDPRYDLTKLADMPGVVFAHKNGFMAVVEGKYSATELIQKAQV